MYDCPCIYCEEINEQKAILRRDKYIAKLEKEAMYRLLNPREEEIEDDYPEDEYADYDDYCDICGEELGSSSHYHCGKCGRECSMMGHGDCDPYDRWIWCLTKDLYGA